MINDLNDLLIWVQKRDPPWIFFQASKHNGPIVQIQMRFVFGMQSVPFSSHEKSFVARDAVMNACWVCPFSLDFFSMQRKKNQKPLKKRT